MRARRAAICVLAALLAQDVRAEIIAYTERPDPAAALPDGYVRVAYEARGASKAGPDGRIIAYAVAGALWRPTKPSPYPTTLFIETQAGDDLSALARRRGMTVLALDLAKLPENVRDAGLRDLVAHLRRTTEFKRVVGRARGRDADLLAGASVLFDGLLLQDARPFAATPTRVIETWSADAYWRATPRLATPEKVEPSNRRRFYLAGAAATVASANCAAPVNARPIAPALRALFVALDDWVTKGVAPPPSRVQGATNLVGTSNLTWLRILGLPPPPEGQRSVPRIDSDGNDTEGLRLPDHALPLATFTGFNAQKDKAGPACAAGAAIPFAVSKAEREKTGDPRLSLPERYGSRAYFVATMRVVADKLVKERLLLQEDADAYVAAAKRAPF